MLAGSKMSSSPGPGGDQPDGLAAASQPVRGPAQVLHSGQRLDHPVECRAQRGGHTRR